MSVALLRENYFWSVYLRGAYAPDACPAYLRRDNFERLRGGLVDNIEIRTATVTEALAAEPDPFDAFVLLDHMDWMARLPALLSAEWSQIFAHAAPDARIIFRSGGPDAAFLPIEVLERLAFDEARAAELHRRDRVATYGSFHIARLAHA
jgi:S-adenosylmethionine-diacylglycerol 3-amino-3-carboxypropyl transferase